MSFCTEADRPEPISAVAVPITATTSIVMGARLNSAAFPAIM